MAELKMKLCGLTEADTRSLKSMLGVISDQLTAKWTIIDSGTADLYIYSFDTDEGMHSWQQHNPQTLSALLTTDETIDENFDTLIKKPLRTKNFSIVLNDIEQKIRAPQQRKNKAEKTSSFLSTLLSGNWFGKKSAASTRPVLNLNLPDNETDNKTTLLNSAELEAFQNRLEKHETLPPSEDIAAYLFSLNRIELTCEKRLSLIESIIPGIRKLVDTHCPDKYKFRQDSHVHFSKQIHNINQVLTECILAYQIVVDNFYQQRKKIRAHKPYGLAINRIAEFSELLLFFNIYYYFSLPHHTFHLLHQLYHYCEYHNVLDLQFESESGTASPASFQQIYKRILLTGIINPYRLSQTDLQQLPGLIAEWAPYAEIIFPEKDAVSSTSNFILDLESDCFPKSLNGLNTETKHDGQIRVFSTQTLLEKIEQIFIQNKQNDELKLLKLIVPQLNASYARQFERKTCHDRPKINLLLGLPAIHISMTSHTPSESFLCTVNNKSTGGMMIESQILDCYSIKISDIVGIINAEQTQNLAIIRWITSNQNGQTFIGLEFMAQATPVTLELENKSDSFIGLIVPVPINGTLKNTILVSKGTYLPLQAMTVTEGNMNYKIIIDKLINNTSNCEQFLYHIKD